jgi:sialic acid synthase SpsE
MTAIYPVFQSILASRRVANFYPALWRQKLYNSYTKIQTPLSQTHLFDQSKNGCDSSNMAVLSTPIENFHCLET